VAVKRGWLHPAGRSALLDVLPAVLAAATLLLVSRQATADQVPPRRPLDATADAIFVLAGLGLVCRRRAPAALLALEVLLGSVHLAFGYPTGPMFILVIVAAYTFACSTGTRLTVAATGPAALALVVARLIGNYRIGLSGAGALAEAGWVLLPALIGGLVRRVRAATARADEEAAGRRVEQERLRVAREVHDVVGHGLSVISLQAGVALHVLARRPEQARPALAAIRATSIEALDQLRATLTGESPEHRQPSGLARLATIVEQVRLSGLPVELYTVGIAGALAPEVDVAALRVVQESLTNVLRHAGPATARVQLSYRPLALEVTVSDDGIRSPARAALAGSGQGLSGLRRRTEELGGSLDAGPASAGGWRVRAILPTSVGGCTSPTGGRSA